MESDIIIVADWKEMNMLYEFPEFNISVVEYKHYGLGRHLAKVRYREMGAPLSGTFTIAELRDVIEKNDFANHKRRGRYSRQLEYIAFLLEHSIIRRKIAEAGLGAEEAYNYCYKLAKMFRNKYRLTVDCGFPDRGWVRNFVAEENVDIDRYFRGINPAYSTYGYL